MKRRRVFLIVVGVIGIVAVAGLYGWLAFWSTDPAPWTTHAYTSHGATVGRMGMVRGSELRFVKPDDVEFKEVKESVPAFGFKEFYDLPEGSLPPVGRPFGLDLSGTQVTNATVGKLASLDHLTHLDLSSTGMNDAGLIHLAGSKHLTHLDLSYTEVTDAGLAQLADIPRLSVLQIYGRVVTDDGVQRFTRLVPRCRVVR